MKKRIEIFKGIFNKYKWDKEFEDTYTCQGDDYYDEGLILDNHNITKLFYDYITGGKVKIKVRKGAILIEKIR